MNYDRRQVDKDRRRSQLKGGKQAKIKEMSEC